MSYGAGHVLDMINRLKQNRAQRPSQRAKFKNNNREAIYTGNERKPKRPNFKTVPLKELIEIKKQIRKRASIARRKERVFYLLFFAFGLIALIAFLIWIN